MRRAGLLAYALFLFVSTMLITSCGKVIKASIFNLESGYPQKARVSVDVFADRDNTVFIRAKKIEVDKEKVSLKITDGLLSDVDGQYAIGFEGIISFPLGGAVIKVWQDGRYQALETPQKIIK